MKRHVLFVCVRNRVRSVYAEFYLKKLLHETTGDSAEKISIASAGFYPKTLKDILDKARIAPPEPFFGIDMSPVVRRLLQVQGIASPDGWRSREITREDVARSDLIVTALSWQKEELTGRYAAADNKIYTFREMAAWEGGILFETFEGLPMNDTFWDRCEEDPPYVTRVIEEVEELMNLGFRNMLRHLDLDGCFND